ncbi:MAG TPA: tetratricopeptide repeat protein [Opitutaceae bacterium]
MEFRLVSAAFIAVFATYLFLGGMGATDRGDVDPRDTGYNQLAAGLLSGHLYLPQEAPPGLAQLADPYDPAANVAFRTDARFRLHDVSFYRGRLYLYFGVAPAVLLFAPWHLATGSWLPNWVAVVAICSAGVLVNLSLVRSVRVRVFPASPAWMTAVFALVLGLGSYAPILLSRASLWEVPIAFCYLGVSVALRCVWQALCDPAHPARWTALASAALGVAAGSRPTVLPAALILLVPLLAPEARRQVRCWAAAALPLGVCVACLALYNQARFGSPFEFGTRYMLSGMAPDSVPSFRLAYFWTNVRLHLFLPVDWLRTFPFVHEPEAALLHANPGTTQHMSGVLLNSPFLWVALAVPVFIRARRPGRPFTLLCAAAAWTTFSALGVLLLFSGSLGRYQTDYVPGLALLACVGLMALETVAVGRARVLARFAWVPAVVMTLAFPVLYGIDQCVTAYNTNSFTFLSRGDLVDAEREVETAKFLAPGNPVSRLVSALILARRDPARGLDAYASLVRDFPDYAPAHYLLANALRGQGRWDEALAHYRTAHRLAPDNPGIEVDLERAEARGK